MRVSVGVSVLVLQVLFVVLGAAPASAADVEGATSRMMVGIMSGNAAMLRAAIEEGADLNANTGDGRTPLIAAAMMSRPEAVKILLERGADPTRKADDPTVGNALTAAFTATNGVELTGRADEPDARKHEAALEVLRLLAATKADPNLTVRRAQTDLTILMIAAQWGALDAVQILLKAGADPNARNAGKLTALDYATEGTASAARVSAADREAIIHAIKAAGGKRSRTGT
jgi:uncharacterized protein